MQRSGSPSRKLDYKRELKELYGLRAVAPVIVDVPELSFLMVDGTGDPNTSRGYREGVEALFAVSYRVKFAVKRGSEGIDYGVMPLEGLWWVDDMSTFSLQDKSSWSWTAMIMQPDVVTEEVVRRSILEASKKKKFPAATKLRFDRLGEGLAAQVLHTGPYGAEGPSIERLHAFIAETGHRPRGKHHEIYLNDPSRSDPAKLTTALKELLDELDANDIVFAFAQLKGPVWDQLKQYGLAQRIGEDHRFPTIGTAVKAYVRRTGTHWVDPVPD